MKVRAASSVCVKALLPCFLLLLIALPANAQSQASTGEIAGVVKDQAGAVIPSAAVTVTSQGTGLAQTVTTDSGGYYRIVLLPPGRYSASAKAKGFGDSTAEAVVGVGRTTDVNLILGVAARKEEVTVTADLLEQTRHEAAAFVGATVISNLPLNGRRFQDVATITPTVQVEPSRNQLSLSGQRGINASIQVDGADYGQLFFGGIRGGERSNFAPTIPLDSIQEFQIVRAGYTAEFGRSTGGTVTAITKSGTNNFHGAGNYNIRHEALAKSTEYYDTVKANLAATCPTCAVNPNPTLQQWGASLGGPVQKDKLFFYGAYEQQRQRLPHQVFFDRLVGFTPTATTQEGFNVFNGLQTPFEQTNDAWLFTVKGDYYINNHHRMNVRYNQNNYQGLNAVSVGASLLPTLTNALSNNGTEIDRAKTVVGNLTSFWSHMANELRVNYARESRPRPANAQQPTVTTVIGTFGTNSFLGQNEEHDYRLQFSDNVTYMRGGHTWKFGGDYSHIYAAQTFGFNQLGVFSFSGVSDAAQTLCFMGAGNGTVCPGSATPLAGRFDTTTARYAHQLGNLAAALSGNQGAFFVQDSWHMLPSFTVNYGLRWEGAWNSQPAANNAMLPLVQGFTFPGGRTTNPSKIPNQLDQFSPRLGFAWDPFKDGKTVVRGFGGSYYAATPLLLYAGPINNYREPPGDLSTTFPIQNSKLATTNVPGCPAPCNTIFKQLQIVGINLNSFPLGQLPTLTVDQVKTIANTINTALGLSFNPYSGAAPISVDGGYRNPRSYQAGFGVERQVAQGVTVGAEATWVKTVALERNREINAPVAACTDIAGRAIYRLTGSAPTGCTATAGATRPQALLGSIQLREASAKSLYRSLTIRSTVQRKWGLINAYYTLSENLSDDDNERSSGGVAYVDSFNFNPEYSYSVLDRKHQFVLSPVIYLPYRFEVSSGMRFLSGAPVDARLGADANQDNVNNDRPYSATGAIFKRNQFRDKNLTFVDLRVQKGFKIREGHELKISAEFFNLFNLMNLTLTGAKVVNFCSTDGGTTAQTVATCGISSFQGAATNGWTPNSNFLATRDKQPTLASGAANPNFGKILTNNNTTAPFQTQFTIRYQF
jgi:outer membrane receptor for ferrienterochelin and colicin